MMIQLEAINGNYKRERALPANYPMRILLVIKAQGYLHMNSGDYDLSDGRIFFIPEEGLVRLEGSIEHAYWLTFSSILYSEFLLQHLDPLAKNLFLNLSYRDLKDNELIKTNGLLEQLKKEISAERDARFLSQYLSLFLGYTANLDGYLAALSLDELQHVLRFSAILEQYYKSERSISFYAEGMGVSKRKLNGFLDKILGKSLSALIKDRIMREAEELLLHSDFTVDEISLSLGFEQTSNFTSAFKRYKGISVSKFCHLG